jgi:hypothetical protein
MAKTNQPKPHAMVILNYRTWQKPQTWKTSTHPNIQRSTPHLNYPSQILSTEELWSLLPKQISDYPSVTCSEVARSAKLRSSRLWGEGGGGGGAIGEESCQVGFRWEQLRILRRVPTDSWIWSLGGCLLYATIAGISSWPTGKRTEEAAPE